MTRLLIKNIGKMVSGDIKNPLIEADTLLVEDGKIARIGKGEELDVSAETVVDAKGITLIPGLIDSHAHLTFCEFTTRHQQFAFLACSHH